MKPCQSLRSWTTTCRYIEMTSQLVDNKRIWESDPLTHGSAITVLQSLSCPFVWLNRVKVKQKASTKDHKDGRMKVQAVLPSQGGRALVRSRPGHPSPWGSKGSRRVPGMLRGRAEHQEHPQACSVSQHQNCRRKPAGTRIKPLLEMPGRDGSEERMPWIPIQRF